MKLLSSQYPHQQHQLSTPLIILFTGAHGHPHVDGGRPAGLSPGPPDVARAAARSSPSPGIAAAAAAAAAQSRLPSAAAAAAAAVSAAAAAAVSAAAAVPPAARTEFFPLSANTV